VRARNLRALLVRVRINELRSQHIVARRIASHVSIIVARASVIGVISVVRAIRVIERLRAVASIVLR
jgi:hypothetical protein